MKEQIKAIDWDAIVDTIRDEKCVLFIGPELYRSQEGLSLDMQLAEYLAYDSNPNIKQFYAEDGFFLFLSKAKKTQTYSKIKRFYNQEFPQATTTFEALAKIPFHLVINTTPDRNCFDTLQSVNGPSVRFDYYLKNGEQREYFKPITAAHPLVYNLFGEVEHQSSMVLTHDDLFSYLQSIFSENDLPQKLKVALKDARNFIFLGFDFRKWYVQLLLRLVYGNNDSGEFMRFAANQELTEDIQTFCVDQFQIEFVPNGIKAFVDALVSHCEVEGVVRRIEKERLSPLRQLRDLLGQDRLDDVLAELRIFVESLRGEAQRSIASRLTQIAGRYHDLVHEEQKGKLDPEQRMLYRNNLRDALLGLVNEAQALQ